MAWYAGVDLGATSIRAVVGDEEGHIHGSDTRKTPQGESGIDITEAVLDALRAACRDAGIAPTDITTAGIGSLGPLDGAAGVVRDPANLPDAIDQIPLTGPVENLIEGPVALHNDANAGAIGERFYADRNPDNMIYLTISSGIGAGVIVDGQLISGWDGNAGEVGHMTVDPEGAMPCGCGGRGHWESYCSGNNIPKYAKLLHDGERTELAIDSPDLTAADVFDAVETNAFAESVIDRVAEWNAQGLAMIIHAYAPIVIYIGGAVALHNPDDVIGRVREKIPGRVMSNVPDIQLTTFGAEVVVKGALASAITMSTHERQS
jgi:glucokinase